MLKTTAPVISAPPPTYLPVPVTFKVPATVVPAWVTTPPEITMFSAASLIVNVPPDTVTLPSAPAISVSLITTAPPAIVTAL